MRIMYSLWIRMRRYASVMSSACAMFSIHVASLSTSLQVPNLMRPSPRPLKVPTTSHDSNALVHDRLADPKVAVNPLADAGRFGELV